MASNVCVASDGIGYSQVECCEFTVTLNELAIGGCGFHNGFHAIRVTVNDYRLLS